jgi:hypothetical protein
METSVPDLIIYKEFKDGSAIQIVGKNSVKAWQGSGLPCFEGDLDGLSDCFPDIFANAVKAKIIVKKVA